MSVDGHFADKLVALDHVDRRKRGGAGEAMSDPQTFSYCTNVFVTTRLQGVVCSTVKAFGWLGLFWVVTCFADLAPMDYTGGGIIPIEDGVIEMERARVEIVWGEPWKMRAEFTMRNPTKESRALVMGFPMPDDPRRRPELKNFSVLVDGVRVAVDGPVESARVESLRHHYWVWYHWKHEFAPGVTQVVVEADLPASGVYREPYWDALHYCMETGGRWSGPIGAEEVVVRFPAPLGKGQLLSVSPEGAVIEGNEVRWQFTGIKPQGQEFDIGLIYAAPRNMQLIEEMRAAVDRDSQSSAAAIRLAKHLLALGRLDSNAGFSPDELSATEFSSLVARDDTGELRNQLANYYHPSPNGHWKQKAGLKPGDEGKLVSILAEAGYRDESSRRPHVTEGESLLLSVLAREPKNAEAWKVYLANYWRFSFAAFGNWFPRGERYLTQKQRQLIAEAARNCPEDECIALWRQMLEPTAYPDSDHIVQRTHVAGYLDVEFSWTERW